MTLGMAERQGDLLDEVNRFCEQALPENSVYAVLHRERDRLFPDEMFADLFSSRGRRSVPPSVVATVMVLQRLEGLSDREAVDRYCFDNRWRYAAGVGGYDGDGWGSFAHTVLVDMRARLAGSAKPRRIFEVTLAAASAAGLVGARRVLDSTPLYDAVATMDTVTLIRSALRALLHAADIELEAGLRALLVSGDDYASTAKPQIDWDDRQAREQLIDSRARDAYVALALLDGRELTEPVDQAAQLLASVVGQDLEQTGDGVFRIARKVAKDRIISTVDPDARHGHKTSARGFDGYKGHVAVDPDSEIVTDTVVSAGNVGDAAVAQDLIDDLLKEHPAGEATGATTVAEPVAESVSEPVGTPAGETAEPSDRPVPADQRDPELARGEYRFGPVDGVGRGVGAIGAFPGSLEDPAVSEEQRPAPAHRLGHGRLGAVDVVVARATDGGELHDERRRPQTPALGRLGRHPVHREEPPLAVPPARDLRAGVVDGEGLGPLPAGRRGAELIAHRLGPVDLPGPLREPVE